MLREDILFAMGITRTNKPSHDKALPLSKVTCSLTQCDKWPMTGTWKKKGAITSGLGMRKGLKRWVVFYQANIEGTSTVEFWNQKKSMYKGTKVKTSGHILATLNYINRPSATVYVWQ